MGQVRIGVGEWIRQSTRRRVHALEGFAKWRTPQEWTVIMGRPHAKEVEPHLEEVQVSVEKMLQDHWRFLRYLTEQQWTKGKPKVTCIC